MTTRKFRVTVDGEAFEVEVEELAALGRMSPGHAWVPSPPPPAGPPAVPPPGPSPARGGPVPGQPKASGRDAGQGGGAAGERVVAPLPGTVVSVAVAPGQTVKTGGVLVILEAMKMKNEITSPRDGKVLAVVAGKGDTVGVGDVLLTLE